MTADERAAFLEAADREARQTRRDAMFFGMVIGVTAMTLVSLVALAVLGVTS